MVKKITVLKQERRPITSIPVFVKDLFALRNALKNKKLWYRGHSNIDYALVPSIGRPAEYVGKRASFSVRQENFLLHRFRRRTYLEAGRLLKAGEALFVARHHGLPTRLLDWTANALFGLYFACHEHHGKDGQLWALERFNHADGLDALKLANCPTEDDILAMLPGRSSRRGIRIIEPLYNSARIRAQDGAFTVHGDPTTPLDSYQFLPNAKVDVECLYTWVIPRASKRQLVEQLSGLGITHRIIFPDLDAIARSLLETEVLWHGK